MSKTVRARLRARQKPFEQLPEWALCCEAMRAVYLKQGEIEVTAFLEPFVAEVECCFCHKITDNVKYMPQADWKHGAIPVDCFEFDEGVLP